MKALLSITTGLCIGMSIANPAGRAAEMIYAVVSQAPNESGRVRVALAAPQGEISQEMDIALIPESGNEKPAGNQNDFRVGDKVVVGFEQNEATGMYETSLTKLEAAGEPQKEQKK